MGASLRLDRRDYAFEGWFSAETAHAARQSAVPALTELTREASKVHRCHESLCFKERVDGHSGDLGNPGPCQ